MNFSVGLRPYTSQKGFSLQKTDHSRTPSFFELVASAKEVAKSGDLS
jgi:hypothetical protein